MSLKKSAVNGIKWSALDGVGSQGIQFIFGLVLARLLSPNDFGLIGILMIFISVTKTLIDSGFSSALIQKKECTDDDFSTIFYFNIFLSFILAFTLYISSGPISIFFEEALLQLLIPFVSLCIIVDSFGIVQKTILIKNINFKLQAKISFLASIASGLLALYFAINNFGVWSLIVLLLSKSVIFTLLLWINSEWFPRLVFKVKNLKELFSFGSKIMLSGILNSIYQNMYYFLIGKYFSPVQLGFYSKADDFKKLTAENFTSIISRVIYPVLVKIQDDRVELRNKYQTLVKITMFISFIMSFGLAAISNSLVLVILGDQWDQSIIYLELLCFVGVLYPLHALNLNILLVKGRSDIFFNLELLKKIMIVPVLFLGYLYGIKLMLYGMIVNSIIAMFMNLYYSGREINYQVKDQLKDIIPSIFVATVMGFVVKSLDYLVNEPTLFILCFQIIVGFLVVLILSSIVKIKEFTYLISLIKSINDK